MRILSENAAKAAVRETRRLGKKRAPARRGNSMSVMAAECVAEPVPAPPKAAARSASLSGPTTPSPKTKKKAPVPTIEVAPGVNLILRGAKETREAIQSDFFVPVQCFSCGTDDVLFAIADADYFVCPCCQGICPVEESLPGKGGVGLGFTIEELERAQWCMIEDAEGF